MATLTKRNLYDSDVLQDIQARIEKLTPDTIPRWGKMNVAQMLAHCSEIQEVMNGKELKNSPLLSRLFKGFIRKMVVGDQPYTRNTQTHPQYRMTGDFDFETQKARLLAAIARTVSLDEVETRQIRHALFGTLTEEERGWSTYKHLDHHLTQFGV